MATREDIRVGDLIRLWGRQFVVLALGNTGVHTRRVPLDPPLRGEPLDGEVGFIEWSDLRGATMKRCYP